MGRDQQIPNLSEGRDTAIKILKYLQQNPSAMDTATAVARWWVQRDLKEVQAALSFLVKRNIVQVRQFGGQDYYVLSEGLRNRAQKLLELFEQDEAGATKGRRSLESGKDHDGPN